MVPPFPFAGARKLPSPAPASEPDVLEGEAAGVVPQQPHRGPRRPAAFGRAARVEDLKAVLLLVEGEMAVAEDDGIRGREAAAQPRQPAPGRAGVVDCRQGPAAQLE